MFALIDFLRIKPYFDNYPRWRAVTDMKRKNTAQFNANLGKLKVFLSGFMIRRSHEEVNISLPPLQNHMEYIDFEDREEKLVYDALEKKSQNIFRELESQDLVMKNYSNILIMLLRLRQICDDQNLLNHRFLSALQRIAKRASQESGEIESGSLDRFGKVDALEKLSDGAVTRLINENIDELLHEECPICYEEGDASLGEFTTCCGHLLHVQCHKSLSTCPLCRANPLTCLALDEVKLAIEQLSDGQKDAKIDGTASSEQNVTNEAISSNYASSKTKHLIRILESELNRDSDRKIIVFSQFTSYLDKVEPFLLDHRFRFLRYDGSMTKNRKDRVLAEFEFPGNSILLMSLKSGNLGLNIICASCVILLDPWWNPMVMNQAIGRVHRIGQTRPVDVYTLIMKKSVEERVLEIQKQKQDIADACLESSASLQSQRLSLADFRILFGI
jgi:SNF2 family DNA or RNA helicase